jgi:hypothetical protein
METGRMGKNRMSHLYARKKPAEEDILPQAKNLCRTDTA